MPSTAYVRYCGNYTSGSCEEFYYDTASGSSFLKSSKEYDCLADGVTGQIDITDKYGKTIGQFLTKG